MIETDPHRAPQECAYCGDRHAIAAQVTGDLWTVYCGARDCYAFGGSYVTREEAVQAWDRVALAMRMLRESEKGGEAS